MAMHWDSNCTMTARPQAFVVKADWKAGSINVYLIVSNIRTFINAVAFGLTTAGSEHNRKKSWKAGENNSGCRTAGQRSINTCVSANGGSACAVSHTVAPSDQMSAFRGS